MISFKMFNRLFTTTKRQMKLCLYIPSIPQALNVISKCRIRIAHLGIKSYTMIIQRCTCVTNKGAYVFEKRNRQTVIR